MIELLDESSNLDEAASDLSKAIENNEFRLLYQPKVNLVSGKVVGVEALIRWVHPKKGVISPLEFIPLAEETGMILPIGEWVLRTACEQLKVWKQMGFSEMIVAVNLSASQLFQPDFNKKVQHILGITGVAPNHLELEITESMMMDIKQVLPILHNLKKLGVSLSMDDFGTGYSSLSYLKDIPIDNLKIDQSFVRNCTTDSKDATIVKTIIAMAHKLNLVVVAEGVETKEQLVFLQQNLCNKAQGYLFSKPLVPEEFVREYNCIELKVQQLGISQKENHQKWLEMSLEHAQQELRETIRMQQGIIFKFIKNNGKFIHTFCDGELLYQMKLTPEQVIGKELNDFLPDIEVETKYQYYEKAWEGRKNITYEGKINDIWYFAALRPIIRGGQVVEVIGSCVDITKRRNMEVSLKEIEYKYPLIAENMQDLIGVIDTHGIVQYASLSHEKVLGFSPQVYEGKHAFDMVHPEDIPFILERYLKAITSKQTCTVEFRYRHAMGHWVEMEALVTPVFGENHKLNHILAVARDISELKRLK